MGCNTGIGQRTAVVTGAATPNGIGFATARRYAQEGWAVALLDLDEQGVSTAAAAIKSEYGVPAIGLACDVTDRDRVFAVAREIAESGLPPVGANPPPGQRPEDDRARQQQHADQRKPTGAAHRCTCVWKASTSRSRRSGSRLGCVMSRAPPSRRASLGTSSRVGSWTATASDPAVWASREIAQST